MGQVFLYALLAGIAVISVFRPWWGVCTAYLIAILNPQAIWWWSFEGVRPVFFVLVPTLIGFVTAVATGRIATEALYNSRLAMLLSLWLLIVLSFFFGSYVNVDSEYRFSDPAWVFSTFNNIFVLCIVAFACVTTPKRLEAMTAVFLVSATYLVYWANDQYLSGNVFGRLAGPVDLSGVGIYSDENSFAMLFVIAGPFFWYAGLAIRSKLIRFAVWLILPLCWHAMFLTASRAGLLGIAATLLVIYLRSGRKILGLLLIPLFVVTYTWQAGDLMRERAAEINTQEESAASRLQAWEAAIRMALDHPLVGVGPASLGPAFPHYSEHKPREAHNAYFQVVAEYGLVAGALFIGVLGATIRGLWRTGSQMKAMRLTPQQSRLLLVNEAVLASLCGFAACAFFASLQMYEIYYFLLVLANSTVFLGKQILNGSEFWYPSSHVAQESS